MMILVSPMTKKMAPLRYGPKTSARIGKSPNAEARRAWCTNWKLQFSILTQDHHCSTVDHGGLDVSGERALAYPDWSRGQARGLVALRCNIQAGFGAVQSIQRALDINIRIAAGQPLLGADFGFARAVYVNFGRTFGGLG